MQHINTKPIASLDAEIADRLKAAREERGFTQFSLANNTKMIDPDQKGISRTAIVGYEQGATKPGIREIRLLCEVLHISPNWLIYGTDNAGAAVQASMELFPFHQAHQLNSVLSVALLLTALKGHERDAILSLALSLAGRQLGDMRLSSLVSSKWAFRDSFIAALKESALLDITENTTLEEISESLSKEMVINRGNKFRFGDDDNFTIQNPEVALYPDPNNKM